MQAQVVSFHCVMKSVTGKVLSSSFNNEVLNFAPAGARVELPGLTAGLQAVREGERRRIAISAVDAYGLYDPRLTAEIPRRHLHLHESINVGDRVHLAGPDGEYQLYRVTSVAGGIVSLDANHPLAGQDLIFEVHVTAARNATAEELSEASEPPPPAPRLH